MRWRKCALTPWKSRVIRAIKLTTNAAGVISYIRVFEFSHPLCSVCFPDFVVQQRHVTRRATDMVVPAWQTRPGLQSHPPGEELQVLYGERGPRTLSSGSSLPLAQWVSSCSVSRHTDTNRPSLHLWNFSHTHNPPVLSFLLFTSLDRKDFLLLDSVFWDLPCLLSPDLLPPLLPSFLKRNFQSCIFLHWGLSTAEVKGILFSHILPGWEVPFF